MIHRFAELRKKMGLSQEQFAERLNLSRSFVNQVEVGKRNISDRTIADICRVFGASETWLRTGEGEMFDETPETQLDELAKEYKLDELDRKMMLGYLKLSAEERAVIKQYMQNVLDSTGNDTQQSEPSTSAADQPQLHEPASPPAAELEANVSATDIETARAEAEEYYRERLLEKRMRTSQGFSQEKSG